MLGVSTQPGVRHLSNPQTSRSSAPGRPRSLPQLDGAWKPAAAHVASLEDSGRNLGLTQSVWRPPSAFWGEDSLPQLGLHRGLEHSAKRSATIPLSPATDCSLIFY